MKVGDDHLQTEMETMSKAGEKVGFKKRKKMTTSVTRVMSETDHILLTSNSRIIDGNVKIKLERNPDEKESDSSLLLSERETNKFPKVYIKSEMKMEANIKPDPSVKLELTAEEQFRKAEKVEERKRMAEKISFNFSEPRRMRKDF